MAATPRTYLYVPADRPDLMARVPELGSDAVILDLEDGIARTNHASARAHVLSLLAASGAGEPELWVRLGPEDVTDPSPLLNAGLERAVLPKLTMAGLATFTALSGDEVQVLGLIESARGVLDSTDTAAHPAVTRLGLGVADLTAELRLAETRADEILKYVRAQIVLASAAAGLPAPVAPTSLRLDDPGDVERTTRRLLEEGFGARTCVHPSQIPAVHRGLTPSEEDIASAMRVLAEFETAMATGAGAVRSAEGELVDEAIARQAREVMARAERSSSTKRN